MALHSARYRRILGGSISPCERWSAKPLDRLLCFLPERLQLEHVARRIVKSLEERGAKFDRQLTFRMPNGTGPWEVVLGPLVEVGKGSRQRSVTVRLWRVKT